MKVWAMAAIGMVLAASVLVNAQNYKAPKIDASGKFTDGDGVKIGMVTKDGVMDDMGMKMVYLDADGNLIDAQSGSKMGKAEKNGNFMYIMSETSDGKMLTVGAPANGMCEVKDDKGKVVLLVHENYKMQAACAYHCAQMKKEGKEMKMK